MKITKLTKTFDDFKLYIEEMTIDKSKIYGLVGSNGCGKSTLAKIIAGLIEPDSGKINLDGLKNSDITMMSQKPYLLHYTVYNNIIYPLKIRKIKPDENEINKWLNRCNMIDKKNQYARSLSSGEQQKLSFIRAIIFNPKLVIIDETLSNLDPDSVLLFKEIILEIQDKNPITWIIISHQIDQIKDICDDIIYLDK